MVREETVVKIKAESDEIRRNGLCLIAERDFRLLESLLILHQPRAAVYRSIQNIDSMSSRTDGNKKMVE